MRFGVSLLALALSIGAARAENITVTPAASGGSGGSGTVTSVDVSGGTTGLTTSGGPVTTAGTITVAGTLAASNGGTGLTSLASGIPAFLQTPTSANLAAALTDETGTGAAVFANGATFIGPNLGTPASGVATNLTGLPISTGVSGLGTGVATALGLTLNGSGALVGTSGAALTGASLNGLTVTTTTGTLTISNGKTATFSNSLTFAGADGSTLNVGAGGTLGTAAFQNTGTSGATLPFLNGNNTFSGTDAFGGITSFAVGTFALPGIIFGTDTTSGWYRSASGEWTWTTSSSPPFRLNSLGVTLGGANQLGWAFGNNATGTPNVILTPDAANVLAQRNGTNGQKERVYQSFTDVNNGSWGEIDLTTASVMKLGTNGNGTGAATLGKLEFEVLGVVKSDFGNSVTGQWSFANTVNVTGQVIASSSVTSSVGFSVASTALTAASLTVGGYAGTGSRPICVTSTGLFEVGSISAGLVTCP